MTSEQLKKIIDISDKEYIEIKEELFENIKIEHYDCSIFFNKCIFNNCIFENNKVDTIDIKNCIFNNCRFSNLQSNTTYIEIIKTSFKQCCFCNLNFESIEQTSISKIEFFGCKFEDLQLNIPTIEITCNIYESKIENCSVVSAELGMIKWKNCELMHCILYSYIYDNILENVKMYDTKIKGNLENNKCIRCTLDGNKYILKDTN